MGTIITFYSYKGGVGRSMALANVAYEMARLHKKVLVVDWDLEAPGLEHYFSKFEIDRSNEGLLQLLSKFEENIFANYLDYAWAIDIESGHPTMHLMQSGRDKDPKRYSADLLGFDWRKFHGSQQIGIYLENMRNQWLADHDLILIDCGAGVNDLNNPATIILPDVVVPLFASNYQSLFGVRDYIEFIQAARQRLPVDRMSLAILPVPSRLGTTFEFRESQEWLDRMADILNSCFNDWLPKWIEPRAVLEHLKVPQVDYFSFGEKLAVVEQGTADPKGLGAVYSRIARFLVSDLEDVGDLVGFSYFNERKLSYDLRQMEKIELVNPTNEFTYDIFASFAPDLYPWAAEFFIPALKEYLKDELGFVPRICDSISLSLGTSWSETVSAIEKSRVTLFILSDNVSATQASMLVISEAIQKSDNRRITIPIISPSKEYSNHNGLLANIDFSEHKPLDFTLFDKKATDSSRKLNAQFDIKLGQLSESITKCINGPIDGSSVVSNWRSGEEVSILAETFDSIQIQPSGHNISLQLMEGIVEKIKDRLPRANPILSELMASKSPGKRLVAIIILQQNQDFQHMTWLAYRVGSAEINFIAYQAAIALLNSARTFARSEKKSEVAKIIELALRNAGEAEIVDRNQIAILEAALTEVEYNLNGAPKPKKLFISYAHEDDVFGEVTLFVDELSQQLPSSKYEIFIDRLIFIGEKWHDRLQREVDSAEVAILLLSPNFLNSKYISQHELKRFIENNQTKKNILSPVFFGLFDFSEYTYLSEYQLFMPSGSKYGVGYALYDSLYYRALITIPPDRKILPNPARERYMYDFAIELKKALAAKDRNL